MMNMMHPSMYGMMQHAPPPPPPQTSGQKTTFSEVLPVPEMEPQQYGLVRSKIENVAPGSKIVHPDEDISLEEFRASHHKYKFSAGPAYPMQAPVPMQVPMVRPGAVMMQPSAHHYPTHAYYANPPPPHLMHVNMGANNGAANGRY